MMQGCCDGLQGHATGKALNGSLQKERVRSLGRVRQVQDSSPPILAGISVQFNVQDQTYEGPLERLTIDSLDVFNPELEFCFCSGTDMKMARPTAVAGFLGSEVFLNVLVHRESAHPGVWSQAKGAGDK